MKSMEFYLNKFDYISSDEKPNIEFLSPVIRRRLSTADKYTTHTLNGCFSDRVENIVFSSRNGEIEKLLKIIEQYNDSGEVSPNTFAGSVHNYPVGFFLMNVKKSIPYTALSSGENSITTGLMASVISQYNNILFCYTDTFEDKIISLALTIDKTNKSGTKYKLTFENSDIQENYNDYIKLFSGEITSLSTPLFRLERISDEN